MSGDIEGYASIFAVPDRENDIVRAGAFRRSLAERPIVPMLVSHDQRLIAGEWFDLKEDSRGLFVRGRIDLRQRGAAQAARFLARGIDGLSIGFTARRSRRRADGGRDLIEIALWEVSIVPEPMAPQARLTRVGWSGALMQAL